MKIKSNCEHCNGTGESERKIKPGDILVAYDGSGMPNALRRLLFNGIDSNPPFKPVRVIKVVEHLIAVVPEYWSDGDKMRDDIFYNDEVNGATT